MNCAACGHDNRESARFCEACGAELERVCAQCGEALRAGAKFCDQCGAPVADTSARTAMGARRPAAEEGERRTVTVLFADAVGHTSISEQLGEEAMYGLMQGCVRRMEDAVKQFEGTVSQFTGDGILALFGAPVAQEEAARRAVAAGLAMQQSLRAYAEEVKAKHPIQCDYRIGVNTGPVVVGRISEKLDLDLAAVGDTVNLAARMEAMAGPGEVYLTESTFKQVRDYFDCECLGPQPVKGKAEPVVVYRALKEKGVHSRFEAAAQRGLTPYVGREHEQALLRNYLEHAERGQGQIVLISGDAGIGKSRAVLEFRRWAEGRPVQWVEGHCVTYGHNIPYLPVVDAFKDVFAIDEVDTDAEIVTKIEARSAQWEDASRRAVPYLRYLLNVDPGDAALAEMDPLERRAGFLDAFRTLVRETARDNPLILVVEDLHWVDDRTEEMLDAVIDVIGGAPVLMLLTARPGYEHRLSDRAFLSRMALGQLSRDDAVALAERALNADLPDGLRELIIRKAEGNPFFIEEVTRSLLESGAIKRENGSLRVIGRLADISVPDTIHEVILSRLDRLDREAREAIQLASVIGREFTARLLKRISDLHDGLEHVLSGLKALELIYEHTYFPELSYMFKHALTHDVAYSTLLVQRRRDLHRTVARAIEELYADRLAEHYEALAHHYSEAAENEKALHYLRKSGDKAAGAYANQEAIAYYTRALELCDALGDSSMRTVSVVARKRANVLGTIGNYHEAAADLDIVRDVAVKLGDPGSEGMALAEKALMLWQGHEFDASEATANEAIALAGDRDLTVKFAACNCQWYNLMTTGRHRESEPYRKMASEIVDKVDAPLFQAMWGLESAISHYWQGDFREGLGDLGKWRACTTGQVQVSVGYDWVQTLNLMGAGCFQDALTALNALLARCERIGEVFYRIRVLNTLGAFYSEIQDFDEGVRWSEIGIRAAQEAATLDSEVENNARLNLGDALVAIGRYDDAEKQYRTVEAIVLDPSPEDRMSLWTYSQHLYASLGDLALARGDVDTALDYAARCLERAQASARIKNEVKARRIEALARAQGGDPDGAIDVLTEILRRVEGGQLVPVRWKALADLGRIQQKHGKKRDAKHSFGESAKVVQGAASGLEADVRDRFLTANAVRDVLVSAE